MVYWTISLLNHLYTYDEYYICIHSKQYALARPITTSHSPHNGCPFNAAMSRGLSSCVVCLWYSAGDEIFIYHEGGVDVG